LHGLQQWLERYLNSRRFNDREFVTVNTDIPNFPYRYSRKKKCQYAFQEEIQVCNDQLALTR
jgi:hypothetical protein